MIPIERLWLRELADLAAAPDWPEILAAYARTKRIVRGLTEVYPLAPERYAVDVECMLHAAWRVASRRLEETSNRPVPVLGEILRGLKDPINRYFRESWSWPTTRNCAAPARRWSSAWPPCQTEWPT
jgi:hypothetical protein